MTATQSFEEERAKMYAQLFDEESTSSKLLGFQNRQVIRGAEALKKAVQLKKSSSSDHKIVLAYTSNIISSGLRECIAALIADDAVDAVVTTAGGIEEDLIKCLGPTLIGDFTLEGSSLRDKGLNRIGNLLVPNNNYVLFESFFRTVLHQHLKSQTESNCAPEHCAPSDILKSSGEYLTKIEQLVEAHYASKNPTRSGSVDSIGTTASSSQQTTTNSSSSDDDGFSEHLGDIDLSVLKQQLRFSVAYQAWKHNVPILCPAFTDGSMGDMTFFFNVSYPGLIVDPLLDCVKLENLLMERRSTSAASATTATPTTTIFSVGGGLPKHFAMRAASQCSSVRKLSCAILITTTAPLTDGSISAGTYDDDVSQFELQQQQSNENSTTPTELIHVRVEATLCVPFMTAMALF